MVPTTEARLIRTPTTTWWPVGAAVGWTTVEHREVVRRRRMVRNFEDRPLDPDSVERLLASARRAPSAGFTQGTELLVLEGRAQTERLWSATFEPQARSRFRWPGLFDAPLVIVPLACERAYLDRYAEADKGWSDRDPSRWPVPVWHVDAAFAAMLVLLAAVDEGLGALFFTIFEAEAFRRAFAIPSDYTPVGGLAVGHPLPDEASRSARRRRRPDEDVIHRGSW